MDSKEHQEREKFFGAAKLMAVLTLASRILGMVRDMAITSLGANRMTSAFVLAFKVPNLFRRLFGEGALSAAFVPVFTETAETVGHDAARKLFANALGWLSVLMGVLMVLGGVVLWAWGRFFPGEPERHLPLVLSLTAVMLPFMVTICLLALGSAALNCKGHFGYPALAPLILNVFIIGATWGVAPHVGGGPAGGLFAIAASVTVAGVVQLGGIFWLLRRGGFSLRPTLRPVEPGIRQILAMMAPVVLGLGLLQICELFNDVLAWTLSGTKDSMTIRLFGLSFQAPLGEGVLVRVNAAQRLYQFPMGVLAMSLGVAVLPLLSRYAARGDLPNLRDALNRALRLAAMEGLAAGTALLVMAQPVTRLIYAHGHFTLADADNSAFILQMYVLGLIAYCTQTILLRAFYATKDLMTPLKISCALVGLGPLLVLSLVWIPALGPGAFGLAMTVTALANVAVLAVILRRRLGRLGGRQLARSLARSLAACGAMAGALVLIRLALAGRPDWLVVLVAVPAGAAVFFAAVFALRCPELGELFGKRRATEPPDAYNGPGETPAP
ncbi:MAG: murein biosynthesis integral membrane protein MurJ [Planctomycetota bacterium]|nr:murein biosynthesis integral membrane protein MurJ [Planctomycetota bacterium]